jgi:hypothetical protein
VITRYTFYQCKHTKGKRLVSINLWEELQKCGLLKGQDPEDPRRLALKGYFAVWNENPALAAGKAAAGVCDDSTDIDPTVANASVAEAGKQKYWRSSCGINVEDVPL